MLIYASSVDLLLVIYSMFMSLHSLFLTVRQTFSKHGRMLSIIKRNKKRYHVGGTLQIFGLIYGLNISVFDIPKS